MNTTLLVVDAIVNLGLGALLIAYPSHLVSLLGMPDVRPSFYARVLGGVLFGIGTALALEAGSSAGQGLGLAGAVAINLCGAAVLAGVLLMQSLDIPLRGRVLLWGLCVLLVGLSLLELTLI